MGHPAFVAGVAKTMLRPLDSILNRRVLTQTLQPLLWLVRHELHVHTIQSGRNSKPWQSGFTG